MANFRAVKAACEAVIYLLQANYREEDFGNELEFKIYLAKDFAKPMTAGVSLFLYRILPNGTQRTPRGRIGPEGQRYRTQLPLDLHFILTVWGGEASLQHTIAGWMMRILEDTPIIPAGILNAVAPDVFQAGETVELTLTDLSNEDLLRIWDTLLQQNEYQLSIPYAARNILIESLETPSAGVLVQERAF